jgi:DnaJ-class molecular chaperone
MVPAPGGGRVRLKVPAGTQSGRVFRIAGKGAPRLKGSGTGDLKVKAKVVVPTELSDRQHELFAELAEADETELRAHLAG